MKRSFWLVLLVTSGLALVACNRATPAVSTVAQAPAVPAAPAAVPAPPAAAAPTAPAAPVAVAAAGAHEGCPHAAEGAEGTCGCAQMADTGDGCACPQGEELAKIQAALPPTGHYGAPFVDGTPLLAIDELMADPGKLAGQDVMVRGKVSALCQKAGCWFQMTATDGQKLRVRTGLNKFYLPVASAVGKMAVAQGKLAKQTVPLEMARQFAANAGGDPAAVTGPVEEWQLAATGVTLTE